MRHGKAQDWVSLEIEVCPDPIEGDIDIRSAGNCVKGYSNGQEMAAKPERSVGHRPRDSIK